jgi:hypothetical protein
MSVRSRPEVPNIHNIEIYINSSIEERQTHLRLDEPCIDRGGHNKNGISFYAKGLLAHVLNTTIPNGHKILCCHACNNGKCINPNHLYWGTPKENLLDAIKCGANKTPYQNTINKYGVEKAKQINLSSASKGGKGNLGKPKRIVRLTVKAPVSKTEERGSIPL